MDWHWQCSGRFPSFQRQRSLILRCPPSPAWCRRLATSQPAGRHTSHFSRRHACLCHRRHPQRLLQRSLSLRISSEIRRQDSQQALQGQRRRFDFCRTLYEAFLMRSASVVPRKRTSSFSETYAASHAAYLAQPDEAALGQAYELGRDSMARGTSLVELAIVHQEAFAALLCKSRARSPEDRLVPLAAEFLAEVLSSYDMAQRGFQDAVSALRRMNELLEEEIKRIAYAVHDEAGQILVAVHLALSNVERRSSPQLHDDFQNVSLLLRQVESQLRQYSHELRPTILDDLGLVSAVRFLAGSVSKRAGVPIRVSAEFEGRLAPAAEIAFYRILQEALTNAVKHSRASSVSVQFLVEKTSLVCKVEDDGIGFDPSIVHKPGRIGLGLLSMRERVNAVGGTFEIVSSSGRGACLIFRVPMNSFEVNNARTNPSR